MNESSEVFEDLKFCQNRYQIISQIGEGTFSTVYKAFDTATESYVAIKAITRTSAPNRVLEELNMLKTLRGTDYCIPLLDVARNNDQIIAVFPLISGIDFKDFIVKSTKYDLKNYLHCLISALKHTHNSGIIHRDLKPSNFLYDPDAELGFLIDFGLAQNVSKTASSKQQSKIEPPVLFFNSIVKPSMQPGYYERDTRPQMKAPRAGTRGFRAPEVLFKYKEQTCAIDMWSVGVILLSALTNQYPFFLSIEDMDGLVEIATIFGHSEMRKAAKLYGRSWKCNISTISEDRIPFETIIEKLNPWSSPDSDLIDLLYRLLDLNCYTRISAAEALTHKYFL